MNLNFDLNGFGGKHRKAAAAAAAAGKQAEIAAERRRRIEAMAQQLAEDARNRIVRKAGEVETRTVTISTDGPRLVVMTEGELLPEIYNPWIPDAPQEQPEQEEEDSLED